MKKRLSIKRNNEFGYFGAVVNDCFIDGAKGSPSIPFGNLDVEEQKTWEMFAEQNNLNAVEFYEKDGTQIKVSRLQSFIIMKLQEKYNKEIENNYDLKKKNWMKSGAGEEPENWGIVHVTAVGLAKEIFGESNGKYLRLIREAIKGLRNKPGYLRYYVRDNKTGKLVPRIEYCSLLTSYGVDITDRRIRDFNWVRLHPIFFSVLKNRFIYNKYFTDKMSEYHHYTVPPMPSLILFRLLSKFGNNKDVTSVQFYSSNLMNIVCHREYIKRQKEKCQEYLKEACEMCKAIGVTTDYKDNIVGETGEVKYLFELNPKFFRNIEDEKKES